MKIKTGDLPGIGKRYSFETAEGENVVVILPEPMRMNRISP
jgi:K+/H+ antiporter YhaU regulatory subunit KhtT